MSQCVGLVLAGGAGRRIGRDKGAVRLGGSSLAERAATALWPLCGSVLISVRSGVDNPAPTFPELVDPAPAGRGPLAGIAAAYDATRGADLLVLACDYPNVGEALLRRIVSHAGDDDDLVMPTDFAGRDHPLVALWRRSAASVVNEALAEERYKVRALLADLRVRRLGPAQLPGIDLDRILLNVNLPEQLDALQPDDG